MACCLMESNRTIYVCGGSDAALVKLRVGADNRVEKLQLDEDGDPVGEWTQVEPMKEKRYDCAAVAVGNRWQIQAFLSDRNCF